MTRLDRQSLSWAMTLSLVAGFVDAIGFLELGGYFVSFMSGNTTRLGISLGDGKFGQALTVAGFVFFFVGGVVLGSLAGRKHESLRRPLVLGLMALLLALSALAFAHQFLRVGTVFILLAMGAENTVLRRDGISLGLTYMTGNLVRMGHIIADCFCGLGQIKQVFKFFWLWASLALGATLGAILHHRSGAGAIWYASGVSLLLAIEAGFQIRMLKDSNALV